MLKFVIAIVLLAHGIGHSLGIIQTFRLATVNPDWDGSSWILSGIAGATATQVVGLILWSVAMVGFIALAGVVVGLLPAAWWAPLAIGSSIASLAGVLLFPGAFPLSSTIGAVVVDVAVLVAVTVLAWTPTEVGS